MSTVIRHLLISRGMLPGSNYRRFAQQGDLRKAKSSKLALRAQTRRISSFPSGALLAHRQRLSPAASRSEVVGKSYSIMLKVHSLRDNIRASRGGTMYFNYLYKQPPHLRPFIKVNRTLDLKCKNGILKHVLVQSIPILFNSKMEPIYFLNIMSDISSLVANREYTHYILDSSDEHHIKKIQLHQHNSMQTEHPEITKSELKVLRLMADGFSSKQIADKLFLSEHTVKNHRKSMLFKTESNSSSELVKRAILEGWL